MDKIVQSKAKNILNLVDKLNQYRHEYYNEDSPNVSDSVYDHLYDELLALEKETGILLSNSPTQTVGYQVVSKLDKIRHKIPLLSLDKTKSIKELINFFNGQDTLLMLKLDGLTIDLIYEDGQLVQASTRGDGEEGELVTHNISSFLNVPLAIPYKKRLEITGEGFIHKSTFDRLKGTLLDSNGKPYSNARNLAAGSIRCLDSSVCKEREITFLAFNILEGLDESDVLADSRYHKLGALSNFGFGLCPAMLLTPSISTNELEGYINKLKESANNMDIPIDGIVARYNSLSYSKSCGRTGHHYKDGKAFKFEDDTYETIFRSIEWTTGRTGEIAPVACFDTIEIDGCDVSRASLHNLSFIKDLELAPGNRILVSKRNMIIPHVEENLDRGAEANMIPQSCPSCGSKTRIYSRLSDKNRIIETLHCDNPNCTSQILRRFKHFASKKAMNLVGISESILAKFLELGFIKSFEDIYHLDQHKEKIINLDGFGLKSYENIWNSIEESRNADFVRFVVAMDIPLIGRTISRQLDAQFSGSLWEFELAAMGNFNFTALTDVGDTLNKNIHNWFHNPDNLHLWRNLQKEMNFKERKEEIIMSENTNSKFHGCTIVATGKLQNFSRDSINSKIISLGATAGSSVTKKTNYLIYGEKAGSKLTKAQELGVTVLSEQEFLDMLSA